jgi:hypothetical protein
MPFMAFKILVCDPPCRQAGKSHHYKTTKPAILFLKSYTVLAILDCAKKINLYP